MRRPQAASSERVAATRALTEFVANSRWEDIPDAIRHEGKRAFLNCYGLMLAGGRNDVLRRMTAAILPCAGPGQALVIGQRRRLDMLSAAFLNAASANVTDFDDTHFPTIIHPAAPALPPVLALAEHRGLSGRDLLHAFILGMEVECRIGNAVSPRHYDRGFHITASCGVFGAAAGAGRLLGLDAEQLLWSMGSAATQSCGLMENVGSMSKSVGVGNSGRNGLAAALFAAEGVRGPDFPIEGTFAFAAVMGSETPDFSRMTDGLGSHWETATITYKAYPCGVVLHPVIDACLRLRDANAVDPASVARVTVSGHPLLGQRTDRPEVSATREAVVSAQHTVAVALIEGTVGLAQYEQDRIDDPLVAGLRRRVFVEDDPAMEIGPAHVSIDLNDGSRLECRVDDWKGSPQAPLGDRDIEEKFRALAATGEPGVDADRFLESAWGLEDFPDMAGWARRTGLI